MSAAVKSAVVSSEHGSGAALNTGFSVPRARLLAAAYANVGLYRCSSGRTSRFVTTKNRYSRRTCCHAPGLRTLS